MIRSLPLLLGLFVASAACAQETDHAGHEMTVETEAPAATPDAPARANDEARPSPNASVSQTIGTTVLTVNYGRPSLRGRAAFAAGAELAPAGEVWRTGANEATTFTTSGPITVEGEALPAGTYALFTIPGDEWTVIFNETAQQWGSFRYDEATDALRVTVVPTTDAPAQEQFQVRFEATDEGSTTMLLHWGTTGVPIEISTAN